MRPKTMRRDHATASSAAAMLPSGESGDVCLCFVGRLGFPILTHISRWIRAWMGAPVRHT